MDSTARSSGGSASRRSSSRARSGGGSEPPMTPDRPPPHIAASSLSGKPPHPSSSSPPPSAVAKLGTAADGGVGGGGGNESPETSPASGSPSPAGLSGGGKLSTHDPGASPSFFQLPPRKRSRNTNYSGRFENGKFDGHDIEVIRPPREKPGQCGSWVWKYFIRFRVLDSPTTDGSGGGASPADRKNSTPAPDSMEMPVEDDGPGESKGKQTIRAICQVPMPLPFGVDRDVVRETVLLCNHVQPFYGVSNLARHVRKIHPELFARETNASAMKRRSPATPDTSDGISAGMRHMVTATDGNGRSPSTIASIWDRDGGSPFVPGFESEIPSDSAAIERRVGSTTTMETGSEGGSKSRDHGIRTSPHPPLDSRLQAFPPQPVGARDVHPVFSSFGGGGGGAVNSAAEIERRCVLWCIQGLHPWHVLSENRGLMWVLGSDSTNPEGLGVPSKSTCDRILQEEYDKEKKRVLKDVTAMRDWVRIGPFAHLILKSARVDDHQLWINISIAFLNQRFEERVYNLESMTIDVSFQNSAEVCYRVRDRLFQWLKPVIQSDLSEALLSVVLERTGGGSGIMKFLKEESLQEALRVPVILSLADVFDTLMQQAFDSVIDLSYDSPDRPGKRDRISSTVSAAAGLIQRLCQYKSTEDVMAIIHHDIAQIGVMTGLVDVDEEVVLKHIAERLKQPLRPSTVFPQPNWMITYLVLERLLCLQSSIGTLTVADVDLRRDCASFDFKVCRELASVLDPFAEFRTISRDPLGNDLPKMYAMMKELLSYCEGDQADVRSSVYLEQRRIIVSKKTLSDTAVNLFEAIGKELRLFQNGEQFEDCLRAQQMATFFDLQYRDQELDSSFIAKSKAEINEELRQLEMRRAPQPDNKKIVTESFGVGLKVSGSFFGRRHRHLQQQRQQHQHQHQQKRKPQRSSMEDDCQTPEQPDTLLSEHSNKDIDRYLSMEGPAQDDTSYSCHKWWSERVGDHEQASRQSSAGGDSIKESLPLLAKLAARYGAYRASHDGEEGFAVTARQLQRLHETACVEHVSKSLFVRDCHAQYGNSADDAI